MQKLSASKFLELRSVYGSFLHNVSNKSIKDDIFLVDDNLISKKIEVDNNIHKAVIPIDIMFLKLFDNYNYQLIPYTKEGSIETNISINDYDSINWIYKITRDNVDYLVNFYKQSCNIKNLIINTPFYSYDVMIYFLEQTKNIHKHINIYLNKQLYNQLSILKKLKLRVKYNKIHWINK